MKSNKIKFNKITEMENNNNNNDDCRTFIVISPSANHFT